MIQIWITHARWPSVRRLAGSSPGPVGSAHRPTCRAPRSLDPSRPTWPGRIVFPGRAQCPLCEPTRLRELQHLHGSGQQRLGSFLSSFRSHRAPFVKITAIRAREKGATGKVSCQSQRDLPTVSGPSSQPIGSCETTAYAIERRDTYRSDKFWRRFACARQLGRKLMNRLPLCDGL